MEARMMGVLLEAENFAHLTECRYRSRVQDMQDDSLLDRPE